MKKIANDMDGVLANIFEQFVKYDEADTRTQKSADLALGQSPVFRRSAKSVFPDKILIKKI